MIEKRRKNLSDVVFDKMYRAIKSGAYTDDERLPTEMDLANEMQVSRPVIRAALRKLREQGLIYSRQGSGSYVRQQGLRDPLGFGELANLGDLRRCYEFRLVLEPAAARLAAERRSDDQLSSLHDALEIMRDATARNRHREDADFQFHHAIAEASGNTYFSTALDALKSHIAVGMQFHGRSLKLTAGGLDHVYGEHRSIYQAIADHDGETAETLMRKHLEGSRDRLFDG